MSKASDCPSWRVRYWTQNSTEKNFGDYLSIFFLQELLLAPIVPALYYRLIGSVIWDDIIEDDMQTADPPPGEGVAFWCCGMREPVAPVAVNLAKCTFFGVRGPLTRDLLKLPATTPMGDPALLLPLLYTPRPHAQAGRTLLVPHRKDPLAMEDMLVMTGAQDVVSPVVHNLDELFDLIDQIVAADFVLAGSMHAAIVAVAYRRPFGFLDLGYVNVRFKFQDFAASHGFEARFHTDVEGARAHYTASVASRLVYPPLAPILGCCPLAVRPQYLVAALAVDAGLDNLMAERLIRSAQVLWSAENAPSCDEALHFCK